MRYLQVLLLLAVLLAVATPPALAQTVSNECLNESYSCNGYWNGYYMSIYGSNMPYDGKPPGYENGDGNTLVVMQAQSNCNPFSNECTDYFFIRSDSDTQTYWYESATQLNYMGFVALSGSGYVFVCRQSGNCTSASPVLTFH